MNKYAIWFRWVVIIGILQDWFFAAPGIFIPNAVLEVAKADPVMQPIWPAFACLLLMLLSVFYIPGAIDPIRYAPLAASTVIARWGGVMFFFFLYPGQFPPLFRYIDLTLAVVQGTFFVLALWSEPVIEPS